MYAINIEASLRRSVDIPATPTSVTFVKGRYKGTSTSRIRPCMPPGWEGDNFLSMYTQNIAVYLFDSRIMFRCKTRELGSATLKGAKKDRSANKNINEPHHEKNNKVACAPSEDLDQPEHPPRLISARLIWVFAVRMKKVWVLGYPMSAQRRLIRLGECIIMRRLNVFFLFIPWLMSTGPINCSAGSFKPVVELWNFLRSANFKAIFDVRLCYIKKKSTTIWSYRRRHLMNTFFQGHPTANSDYWCTIDC